MMNYFFSSFRLGQSGPVVELPKLGKNPQPLFFGMPYEHSNLRAINIVPGKT